MTPSNPTNSQPLIYRIADALGITHLVVAVNHTHAQSEVEGLESALAGKANAVAAGSPSDGIVIAGTSGELARSNKTVQDLLNALAAKANANHTHSQYALTTDVNTALAAKMSNTALSIEVEYHMTSQQVKYYGGASSIFTSVPENKIAVAMLYFFSNEGHNPLGNTLVQLRWYNSVNNIYKYIEIFINGAVYNLRYKVETEEWREMVQTAASITQYLPTSAE